MKNQILLNSDVFNIVDRLKEIDDSYFVVFNFDRNSYEVHSKSQMTNTYAFSVPFDSLDDRTIDLARKTRSERLDEIIKEIDYENEKREKLNEKRAVEQLKEVLR